MSAFTGNGDRYKPKENDSFISGEKLDYRVHFGFISAGEATLSIDNEIEQINNRPCFKIDVSGQTSGFFDFFYTVRDSWGTYLDTVSLVPHKFYEDKRENKYRKHEVVEFNHTTDSAKVYRVDKDRPTEYFKNAKTTTRSRKRLLLHPHPGLCQYFQRRYDFVRCFL